MELAKYKACICEGSTEEAIIDILVDNDLLISKEKKCWKNVLSVAEVLNDLRSDTYGRDSMSRFDVKDYPDFFDIFSQKNGVFCQNFG